MDAVEARIRVGETKHRREMTDGMREAVFTLELDAGSTTIQTWFVDDDGQSRGACYLYVERLPGATPEATDPRTRGVSQRLFERTCPSM
jgi:hypothetical protein